MRLETVRVEKDGGGFKVINEIDFNPKVDTLYDAPAEVEEVDTKTAPETETSVSTELPEGYSVENKKGGFWTVSYNDVEVNKGRGKDNLAEYLLTL